MNCAYCGKEESLPFVCNYCGETYCADHRLPESHRCTGDLTRRPVVQYAGSAGGTEYGGIRPQPLTFSKVEIRDILIAWITLGVAFSLAITGGILSGLGGRLTVIINGQIVDLSLVETFLLALFTIGIGFVLHELMHKFIAERYGYEAAFKMWPSGLAFAILSALIAGIVFAAPGATYIMGYNIRDRENGIISLAGPVTNIIIAVLFLPFLLVNFNSVTLLEAGYLGSYFNFFLATFNMLPIFVLDGAKVWRWNKVIWVATFIPLVLIVASYLYGIVP